jgi:hypothetical protein
MNTLSSLPVGKIHFALKHISFWALLLFLPFTIIRGEDQTPTLVLNKTRHLAFQLHFWERQPNRLPQRILPVIVIEIDVNHPAGPGFMQVSKKRWSGQSDSTNKIEASGELQVAWAFPFESSNLPQYFTIQLTIEHPYRAQCAMTPKVDDIGVPSLLCNQWPENVQTQSQLGATLIDQRVLTLP